MAVWTFCFVLSVFLGLIVAVWCGRVGFVTQICRAMLDRQGLSDVTFRLSRLSLGSVVVEDLHVGVPEAALTIDHAEARFSFSELRRGHLSRLRVRGVRTPVVVDARHLSSPLQQRLSTFLSARADKGTSGETKAGFQMSAGEVSVYDIQVPVQMSAGGELVTLRGDASLVAEPREAVGACGRYRVWSSLHESAGIKGTLSGTVISETGTLLLTSEIKVEHVEGAVERVRLVWPDQVAGFAAAPTNCSLSVRGKLSLSGWTNMGPFEVTAELGRGSAFALAKPDCLIRFQTLRVEASGTPQAVDCRLSAGIAGIQVGKQMQASQDEGRLLSVRGTACFLQTLTNRQVRASFDSGLPGKSVARVLPEILPLLPRLLTEGGTLHAEADLNQPLDGKWQGQVAYQAEARRSAITLPAGRVGAGRVSVEGLLCIQDASFGPLVTDIRMEEGYFFRSGLSLRGGGNLSLRSQPPYRSAVGTFGGTVSETVAVAKRGLVVPDGGIRFEGTATVDGLVSNPVWRVDLSVPEFGVSSQPAAASWSTVVGAAAQVEYTATRLSLNSDVWARDAAVCVVTSGKVGRVEAGIGRITAHIGVVDAHPSALSNTLVHVNLNAQDGWSRAGDLFSLEGGEAHVPFSWSLAQGVRFGEDSGLSWRLLNAGGIRLVPGVLTLRTEESCAAATFGIQVDGSRFGLLTEVRMPFSAPQQGVIDMTVPATELLASDRLAERVKRVDPKVEVSGRFAAKARVRFLGTQPHVLGRLNVSGGRFKREGVEVLGVSSEVAFEGGLGFRTIERPVVTFNQVKAGNIRLDKGRVEFQITPEEVFVDRVEVGWCKGSLNAYSLHVNPNNPKADVIVYADRIDLGEALMMVMPFKGSMEGVLYGRFPVGIEGRKVKLRTGYLYSLPGQGGVLRLEDSRQMLALLNRAGIKGDVQQPLSKALSDMDFSAIRMELDPEKEGDTVFRIKLEGKSNFKEWPAPVALNLNLHGPLEELLNLGLSVSR
jgi:hypothetical protein